MKIWRAVDGSPVATILPEGDIEIVEFLGEELILASDQNGIAVWDVAKQEKQYAIPTNLSAYVRAFPFENGNRLALLSSFAGQMNKLEFWDLTTRTMIKSLVPHNAPVRAAAVSPDGSKLVTGSDDNVLKVWDLSSLTVSSSINLGDPVQDANFSHSGDFLVAVTNANDAGDIFIWDVSDLDKPIRHLRDVLPRGGRTVEFGPDEQRILATSFSARASMFDLKGKLIKQFRSPSLLARIDGGVSSAIFIDEHSVATGADNGEVTVWYLGGKVALYRSEEEINRKQGLRLEFKRSKKLGWFDYEEVDYLIGRPTGDLKNFLVDSKRSSSGISYVNQFDEKRVLITWSGANSPVRVWDTESGAELLELNHQLEWIESFAYSKEAGVLVAKSLQTNSEGKNEARFQTWPFVRPLEELISLGRDRLMRCLSPDARVAAGLSAELPNWCIQRKKVSSQLVD